MISTPAIKFNLTTMKSLPYDASFPLNDPFVIVEKISRKGKRLDRFVGLHYNRSMIEKMIRIGRLYDVYGELLTERQRKCLDLHYMQDLSLGEIAAELGVSRQAINDILHRTEESLEQYEEKLKLLEQDKNRTEMLLIVRSTLIEALAAKQPSDEALQKALTVVDQILK